MDELKIVAMTFTNQCNLQCTYCGHKVGEKYREEQPTEFFLDVLDQASSLGADFVNITGGEVFCRKDCFELIDGAINMGYSVGIESNGTLLNEKHIQRLSDYGNKVRISVSLDGRTAEVHDATRGSGNFAKTMDAIELLSKYDASARVITVLNKNNLRQIPDLVRHIVDDLGLGFRLLPNIMEYGRGVYTCNALGVSYRDTRELLDDFYYDFIREKKSDKLSIGMNIALVPTDIDYHTNCRWATEMIGITPYGQACFCHVSGNDKDFVLGDLKELSLENIWKNNDLLKRFRNMNPDNLKGICGNCAARELCCGGCRVHAIAKYKDFLAPDPQCQIVYDMGLFPEYAMEDVEKICEYGGNDD